MSKILIIENEVELTTMYTTMFSMYNCNAVVLLSGQNIKTVIQEFKPDVILSAIHLGREDGRDICRAIKQTHKDIPVIMVSTMNELKKISDACGADDYIEKPFDIHDMMNKVSNWAEKYQQKISKE